ncbi:hypothetical protein COW98_04150 [Candidatus Roizmanbacteria bacterium CG22_combo_CG10-13_8_21_14_all_35_9]|uniref:Uncharacterized protein n=4 Tax=Candidatus Roizmaniibacteriota TaxID=1752723 RepID=A0A2M8F527_9BACT|nr:MAG: hypothetical protein COX47_03690 [Candidatus Roizmanbacteria bacterium CG23_combo_of_CG06-09_8_20_14_all_35_49]PIP62401.1 MAG: hypothetical protein COW98_04150 [Candidatus Roizmanbacteria bacterium CG22_combo_CG10-13_8_21_14_all_35_9]PIY71369.1 MAG: hypothetical protein COY88_00570 [Candidatus Roizmanbacteria bacterium CG_4_10_14_0_8_um_filter_35_28]PJC34409.1 MAG: hypothetical protein CO048_00095 [Candidatus Roizmanbacteria bacterium CG_4_9_14_0_2_um_filter_35_15]PJC82557.1 MAG: hypoth
MLNLLLFTIYAQGIQEWGDCVTPEGVPTLKCLEVVFGNILFMSSAFIILVLFIMFIIGAFRYLTSFGNAEKMKKAKGTLTYALVGFILFVSAFLILKIIDVIFLGGNNQIFQFNIGE